MTKDKFCFECDGYPAAHKWFVIPRTLGGNRSVLLCEKCWLKTRPLHSYLIRIGLGMAQIKGVRLGRPQKVDTSKIQQLRDKGLSLSEIGKKLGCSKSACSKILSRLALVQEEKYKHEINKISKVRTLIKKEILENEKTK